MKFASLLGLALLLTACGSAAAPVASSPSAAASAPASNAASAPASGAKFKMVAGYSVISANQIQLWAPAEGGYFANEGLDVQAMKAGAGTAGLSALISGNLNVLITSSTSTMNAAVEGAPVVFFGSTMERIVQYLMAKKDRSDLNTRSDMRGKKVGMTTPGSYSDVSAHIIAHEAGLEEGQDYTAIRLNDIPTIQGAIENGAIDLGMIDSKVTAGTDLKIVADLSKIGQPLSTIGFSTTRSFYQQHPEEFKAFGRAYAATIKRLKSDPVFVSKVLAKYMQIDDPEKLKALGDEALPLINDELVLDTKHLDTARQYAAYSLPKLQTFDVAKIMP